jgi:hypothetical protein
MSAGLVLLILTIPLALGVGLVVGALILRIACSICRVELPGFFKAMGVTAVVAVVSLIACSALGFIVGVLGHLAGISLASLNILSALFGLPLGMLVSALLYKVLLPTTFGKGVLIWLVHLLFAALIYGVPLLIMYFLETYTHW